MPDVPAETESRLTTSTVWIDAQLPPALAHWIRTEHGTDAVHVDQLGLLRARDSDIFTAARGAPVPVVVVTKDDDFAKLLDQKGPPPKVIWLRCAAL